MTAAVLALLLAGWARQAGPWVSVFPVAKTELVATGRNRYFVLEPGVFQVYEHGDERLVITVLDDTLVVDGVTTRVVEERETKGGVPVEVSRNYFAIDPGSQDVYYFGEDVDVYRHGKLGGREGSWRSGVGGARFGLMMPGRPSVGFRHYQELAPGVALDRAEIVGITASVSVPAGRFRDCLKVEETSALEPGAREFKFYAPGVGLVRDGSLVLVRSGRHG